MCTKFVVIQFLILFVIGIVSVFTMSYFQIDEYAALSFFWIGIFSYFATDMNKDINWGK